MTGQDGVEEQGRADSQLTLPISMRDMTALNLALRHGFAEHLHAPDDEGRTDTFTVACTRMRVLQHPLLRLARIRNSLCFGTCLLLRVSRPVAPRINTSACWGRTGERLQG